MTAERTAHGMRLTIVAEADPLVFVRVLHMVGSLNLIPRWAAAERVDDETIRIELELPVHERLRDALFCKRVLTIPTVISLHDGWELEAGAEAQ